jgi:esterase/lipase superfamily enzyme
MNTPNSASLYRDRTLVLLVAMAIVGVSGCARSERPGGSADQTSTAAPAKPPASIEPDTEKSSKPTVSTADVQTPRVVHHHAKKRAVPPPATSAAPPPPPVEAAPPHIAKAAPPATASEVPPPVATSAAPSPPLGWTAARPKPDSNTVRVFYATDRQPDGSNVSPDYGPNESPDGHISYGIAAVSIPPDHRMGKLEEPILDIKILYNPEKYVTILGMNSADEATFFNQLKTDISGSPRKQALIFIHGFNVSFPDALRRTAQLSYDLQFRGATICYSWPSRGSMFSYTADEDSVQWTALHLLNFLQAVYTSSGATSIDIIAHSMGNRALLAALQLLGSSPGPQFDQVILAAPDVAASLFTQLVPTVQKHARRITLYASSKDQALVASARVNHYRRAGDSTGMVTIIPPVETIDASTVDTGFLGHSYFGDNASVLSDLYYLLKDGFPAAQRSRLEQKTIPAGIYWAFRP